VTLVDESAFSIIATLWGDMCERHMINTGDIIAISGARVSEFGGKSLNAATDHADLIVNPNHERARKLSMWYTDFIERFGNDAINKIKPLTNKM
jgi:ssDNA-binding replication factor A large subunit